ncbi:tetratricopeptide repeat protein [Candidatus Micrarchaeota archaeon]|nr:tetratricopeptide repeat protein [Candidatus Micrarchaeota archaeon]
MDELSKAREYLVKQKYKEAEEILSKLLAVDKENDEIWYLRGVLSLKLKNYKKAQECFERALLIKKKAEYYKMKGMCHFEVYELEDAVESFLAAVEMKPTDAVSYFFIAMSYMLLDDDRAIEYIRKAREIDAKKTKQLLSNFYTLFLERDPYMTDSQKKRIVEKIKSIE